MMTAFLCLKQAGTRAHTGSSSEQVRGPAELGAWPHSYLLLEKQVQIWEREKLDEPCCMDHWIGIERMDLNIWFYRCSYLKVHVCMCVLRGPENNDT